MHNAQEEEGATGQEHAMRPGVVSVGFHTLAILVPLYTGRGSALCLTVEGGRLPLGDDQIGGVLRNPRSAVFKPWPGPWEAEIRTDVIQVPDPLQYLSGKHIIALQHCRWHQKRRKCTHFFLQRQGMHVKQ